MATALELRHLRCARGDRVVVDDFNACLPAATMLRLDGENGSGKTSLLRVICGLSRPDHGEVLWQGASIHRHLDAFHAQLLYLGHSPALKDELTAVENLQLMAHLAGGQVARHAITEALAAAGLAARAHLPVRALSRGQRQRVSLARLALGAATPLWVLDEPFASLDADGCDWLRELVTAHLRRGCVAVVTSHQDVGIDAAMQLVVRLDTVADPLQSW